MICTLCGKEITQGEKTVSQFNREYHMHCYRLAEDAEEEAMKTG